MCAGGLLHPHGTNLPSDLVSCGMKTEAVLACALGFCAWGCLNSHADQAHAALPYAEIYDRATNEFAEVHFFKPAESRTNDLSFTLAPLIIQDVNRAIEPLSSPDRFGMLSVSNRAPVLDRSRPAIYWEADTVQVRGKAHARFSYVWCYSPGSGGSERGPGADGVPTARTNFPLPLQGIRITLDSAGQPVIWEVLADNSGAKLIFVSRGLEAAAAAEFGKPLSGRRYAIECSVETAPEVIVARVIDDGPVAMGPIVYLSAGTREVSTLICRCMPAQARKLQATSPYDLLPFQAVAMDSFFMQTRAVLQRRAGFWPGDDADGKRIQACLRLPEAFSRSQGASAR